MYSLIAGKRRSRRKSGRRHSKVLKRRSVGKRSSGRKRRSVGKISSGRKKRSVGKRNSGKKRRSARRSLLKRKLSGGSDKYCEKMIGGAIMSEIKKLILDGFGDKEYLTKDEFIKMCKAIKTRVPPDYFEANIWFNNITKQPPLIITKEQCESYTFGPKKQHHDKQPIDEQPPVLISKMSNTGLKENEDDEIISSQNIGRAITTISQWRTNINRMKRSLWFTAWNDDLINKSNHNVLILRNRLNIFLQSQDWIKDIALQMNKKILEITLQLASVTGTGHELLVSEINKGMKPVFPGAFVFTKDFLDVNKLNELNFRELMQLFNTYWNCSIVKVPILLTLILKYIETPNRPTGSETLIKFFRKYNQLKNLLGLTSVHLKEPFCKSYDPNKTDKFSNVTFIKEPQPVTVSYNDMSNFGVPLSDREKSITTFTNGSDNIGWVSGASLSYVESGTILEGAIDNQYDLLTGLSGSSWKYYMLCCCLDVNISDCKWAIISFLNGCFHHSVYECTLTATHYNEFLQRADVQQSGFCNTLWVGNIDFNEYEKHLLSYIIEKNFNNDYFNNKLVPIINEIITLLEK